MKEFKSFYKEVTGNEGGKCRYNKRLDTYGCGCAHDCSYCYAKSLLSFRGLWDAVEPSVANLARIERKIAKLEPGTIIRLGGMTDCFQPIERREGITKATIELLNKHRIVGCHAVCERYKQFDAWNKERLRKVAAENALNGYRADMVKVARRKQRKFRRDYKND